MRLISTESAYPTPLLGLDTRLKPLLDRRRLFERYWVKDPSFEVGGADWTIPITMYAGRISKEPARTGDHSALVGVLIPGDGRLSYSHKRWYFFSYLFLVL